MMPDVERALQLFQGVDYDQTIPVADGIDVIFRDAGHILGSAMLELLVKEGDDAATNRLLWRHRTTWKTADRRSVGF